MSDVISITTGEKLNESYRSSVAYLVDQQMSQRFIVQAENVHNTCRPINVLLETPMLDLSENILKLSKEQASALGKMLIKAAEYCPDIEDCEYPGKVL